MKDLIAIQSELKAPKNQHNAFGKYNYRSAEDILEALKPLLLKHDCLLTVHDEIEQVGERIYIKAVATICKGESVVRTTAYAREEDTKKGMDSAQITGSASSYARKYALNGLFLIDDTKDPDSTNKHGKDEEKPAPKAPAKPAPKIELLEKDAILDALKKAETETEVKSLWYKVKAEDKKEMESYFQRTIAEMRGEL